MATRHETIASPRRYAFAALHGKVREWFRSKASKEIPVGIGREIEEWLGVDRNHQLAMERAVLFAQLKTKLSGRDRNILVLLQQDITSPAKVGSALGITYTAAAKAIQRVKERIAAILKGAPLENQTALHLRRSDD